MVSGNALIPDLGEEAQAEGRLDAAQRLQVIDYGENYHEYDADGLIEGTMLCSIGKVCLQRLVNYQGNSRCKALGGELNSNDVMGCGVQDV